MHTLPATTRAALPAPLRGWLCQLYYRDPQLHLRARRQRNTGDNRGDDMPTLDWLGKSAVVHHHHEVPFHLWKCDDKLSVGDPGSGNLFEPFEATHFLETPWQLSACNASLSEAEYSSQRPSGQQGEIRITEKGQLEAQFLSTLQQQMMLLESDHGWTVPELVYWLDRAIPHPDIVPAESGAFLTRLVRGLMNERGLSIEQLAHDKYRLKPAVAAKIDSHRQRAHRAAYQALLLPESNTPLVVTPEVCFSFDPATYPYNRLYPGSYKFNKHYYRRVGDLDGQGEEFECAQFIDSLDEVQFWVRNLERRPAHAFWLQTATDRFYPDFVALLKDGRYLVVEFKGEHLWSNADSVEKRDVGGLWGARSAGQCLFVMPRGKDFAAIRTKMRA